MDQRAPLICSIHRKAIVGMCLDQECMQYQKLYCNICYRKEHSECDDNKSLAESEFIQELKQLDQDLRLIFQWRIDTNLFFSIKNELTQQLYLIEQQIIPYNIKLRQFEVVQQRIQSILQNRISEEVWIEGYGLLQHTQKSKDNSFEEIHQNLEKLQQSIDTLSQTKRALDISQPQNNIQNEMQNMTCDWGNIAIRESFHFKSPVRTISCSTDGKLIACCGDDYILRVFDPKNGKFVIPDLEGHTALVYSVSFSKDNKLLVSGGADKTVRIWDVISAKQISEPFGHAGYVYCVTFSPDSKQIASGCQDNSIRIWSVFDRQFKILNGHTSHVWSIDYSPDGNLLVSGGYDNSIRLWDTQTGKQLAYNLSGHDAMVFCVRFSANGKNIVSGSADHTARIWDVETGQQLKCCDVNSQVRAVAYSPNGDDVISGSDDSQVILWNTQSNELKALKPHTKFITSLQYSPDGRYIVSGSYDMTIKVQAIE